MNSRWTRRRSPPVRNGFIGSNERIAHTESPYVRFAYCEDDSFLWNTKLTRPLVQKAALNVPAGEIINFSTYRTVPFGLYVTVITGVCDVFIAPANPTVDQPDMRFKVDYKPGFFRCAPGPFKFYVRAGALLPLTASLLFVDLK